MPSTVDLHIHTTASDGSISPDKLPALLAQHGIHTFAITDHDTIDGAVEVLGHVPPGMRFIPGVEFSCYSAVGKYHILGYGYRPDDPLLHAAIEEGRQLRRIKLSQRIAGASAPAVCGTGVSAGCAGTVIFQIDYAPLHMRHLTLQFFQFLQQVFCP